MERSSSVCRYERAIWAADDTQRDLASQRRKAWSKMPVVPASSTFFTQAKLDHQVTTKGTSGGTLLKGHSGVWGVGTKEALSSSGRGMVHVWLTTHVTLPD